MACFCQPLSRIYRKDGTLTDIRQISSSNEYVGITHHISNPDRTDEYQINYKIHVPTNTVFAELYRFINGDMTVLDHEDFGSINPTDRNTLSIQINSNSVTLGLNGVETEIFIGLYNPVYFDNSIAYVHAHDVANESDINLYVDNLTASIDENPPATNVYEEVFDDTSLNPSLMWYSVGEYEIINGEIHVTEGPEDSDRYSLMGYDRHGSDEVVTYLQIDVRANSSTIETVGLQFYNYDHDDLCYETVLLIDTASNVITARLAYGYEGGPETVLGNENLGTIDPTQMNEPTPISKPLSGIF